MPSQVLVDLTIELSAGMATLDLNELILRWLTFTMGAGQGTVYLPTEGIFDATINSGLGKLTIYIQSGMAVKFDPNIALVSPRLPVSYIRQGDKFTSPDFEQSENRIALVIKLLIGQVTVIQR